MTKSVTKKLKLARETVRALDARPALSHEHLKRAAGGLTYRCVVGDSDGCLTNRC